VGTYRWLLVLSVPQSAGGCGRQIATFHAIGDEIAAFVALPTPPARPVGMLRPDTEAIRTATERARAGILSAVSIGDMPQGSIRANDHQDVIGI